MALPYQKFPALLLQDDDNGQKHPYLKSFGTTGNGEDQEGYGITIDSNGDYVIGGLHYNTVGTNFYLMKVASSGYSCASIQDNGATTNLTAPTLTNTTSATTSPASTKSSPAPSTNTGGVIVEGCMTTTPILLPIQLINFDGKAIEEYNHVFWETQSERENDYFTVEKSANGLDWEILGNVDGAGNSIAELHYSLNDYHPYFPITYYKLKQTDFNGVYVYSDIIALTRTNSGDLFSLIYPNPTKDKFNFIYNGKKDSFELKIYNALGELIEQHSFDGKKNTEEVSLSAYSTGLYFVHFIQNQHTSIQKIIKN